MVEKKREKILNLLRSENPETAAAAAADVIRLAWLQRSSEQLLRADRGARNLLRLLPAVAKVNNSRKMFLHDQFLY